MTEIVFDQGLIYAGHKDVVTDIAIDFYGDRVATCSADNYVKIWNITDDQNKWNLIMSWKAHNGIVWKVDWAHPAFGRMLATCSYDCTVAIWEETEKYIEEGILELCWTRRAHLKNGRTSVIDVKFSPATSICTLASCSIDGVLRVYESKSDQWSMRYELSLKTSISCFTWNPTITDCSIPRSMIAVGSNDKSNITRSKLFICEYNDIKGKWVKQKSITSVSRVVNDLRFAPNRGQSYSLLAVATNNIQIFKLTPIDESIDKFSYKIETVAQLDDHSCIVQSITWTLTNTGLASLDENGCVRLWKEVFECFWKCEKMIRSDKNLLKSQSQPYGLTARRRPAARFSKPDQILQSNKIICFE